MVSATDGFNDVTGDMMVPAEAHTELWRLLIGTITNWSHHEGISRETIFLVNKDIHMKTPKSQLFTHLTVAVENLKKSGSLIFKILINFAHVCNIT